MALFWLSFSNALGSACQRGVVVAGGLINGALLAGSLGAKLVISISIAVGLD